MIALRTLLLASVALGLPAVAWAQTAPATPRQTTPAPAQATATPPAQATEEAPQDEDEDDAEESETAVEEVTVTGSRGATRTSIDSISYSTADDLQAATGTLADALRNVPSVDVDVQGNVSLRGDSNVTILIDGRPAAMLEGQARAQAVLSMSASQFSRIEVMTNPSAAYRPDGSGGVINLISNPNVVRPAESYSGSVRVNVGTEGRYNFGLNGAWQRDNLTITGDLSSRHDRQTFDITRLRERYDVGSGRFLESRQVQDVVNESDGTFARLAAEYRFDETTQLNLEIRNFSIEARGNGVQTFEGDDANGALVSAYERRGTGGFEGSFSGASARLLRQFGEGHDWTTELRYDFNDSSNVQEGVTESRLPAAPLFYEAVDNANESDSFNLSSTYNRPLENGAKLRLGYDGIFSDEEFDSRVSRGPSPGAMVIDPTVTNLFRINQSVQAVFGTYERPFGDDFAMQLGLRLENVEQDLDQVTTAITASNSYFRVYPTLHIDYSLTDTQTLRASYSRRVQRPQANDLNPFRTYQDPQNYRAGNPDLEPQTTDAFEVSWLRRANQTFYQATVYYRDTSDAFTNVFVDLGGGVLLSRPENLGSSRAVGLELVANGRLHESLRYNASLNFYNQRIDASNLGFGDDQEATTVAGRVNFNFTPTVDDFIQLGLQWNGEQIFANGTRDPSGTVNLGYRRKLNDRLSLQFTVRDLFETQDQVTFYETPILRDRSDTQMSGRQAFIGLTWTFGRQNPRQQPQGFDFSNGQAPGA